MADSRLPVSGWKYSFRWGLSYLFHLARKWLTTGTPFYYYYISSLIQKRFSFLYREGGLLKCWLDDQSRLKSDLLWAKARC